MLYARRAVTAVTLVLFLLTAGGTAALAATPAFETVALGHSLNSGPKKLKNDSNCVASENLNETADKYISRCRKGSIRSEFPSQFLQAKLGEIKSGSSADQKKAWKLLNDGRFKK